MQNNVQSTRGRKASVEAETRPIEPFQAKRYRRAIAAEQAAFSPKLASSRPFVAEPTD